MLITRLAKILMCLALALFCLLVAYDKIADPHSNYEFVSHVMSTDTTFPDNRLMYRSVTNQILWQIVYALIIATQLVIAGEWFAMWQSKDWNAQQSSFRFYVTALAVLIFLNMQDGELKERITP
jgi:predicted small integral membrane protein